MNYVQLGKTFSLVSVNFTLWKNSIWCNHSNKYLIKAENNLIFNEQKLF